MEPEKVRYDVYIVKSENSFYVNSSRGMMVLEPYLNFVQILTWPTIPHNGIRDRKNGFQ